MSGMITIFFNKAATGKIAKGKVFFGGCLLYSLLAVFGAAQGGELPSEANRLQPLEQMEGEVLVYDLAFLWFDRLAEATFTLNKAPAGDRYRALLEVRTLGVAGWLTGDRVQRYASELYLDDGVLRPLQHDSNICKSHGDRVKTRLKRWVYDCSQRAIVERVTRNGRRRPERRLDMGPGACPFDILGAFYNFRAGLFTMTKAGSYRIPSFAKGRRTEIMIDPLADNAVSRGEAAAADGRMVRVVLDPEVFDVGSGVLVIRFDRDMRPVEVQVEDVLGAGDVRATLRFSQRKAL